MSVDGQIVATLPAWISPITAKPRVAFDLAARRDSNIAHLADALEQHFDWPPVAL